MVSFSRGRGRGNRYPRYHHSHHSPKYIHNPRHLVEEFKRTGAFDDLRRQLLQSFQDNTSRHQLFLTKVQKHLEDKLEQDPRIRHRTYRGRRPGLLPLGGRNAGHEELLREILNGTRLVDDVVSASKAELSIVEPKDNIIDRLSYIVKLNGHRTYRHQLPPRPNFVPSDFMRKDISSLGNTPCNIKPLGEENVTSDAESCQSEEDHQNS